MNKDFKYYISKYFKEYLPLTLGVSKNSIRSYKTTFLLLLEYLNDVKKINVNSIDFENINFEIIEDFLNYLEIEKKNSIRTRNQRLAAIHSFYKYIQKRELKYFELCSNILSISNKKVPESTISYFSLNEIEILINTPNTKNKNGFRDYVMLLTMYETAARGQELCDLTRKQVVFSDVSYIILIGKGEKERSVPISKELEKVIKKYFDAFSISENDFIFKSKFNHKFTTKGIEYTLKKYINIAKAKYKDKFNGNYSNHTMRHTRAMHLLEAGVNLIYIRDILGHTSVITTEIYAKTNPIIKAKQISEYGKQLNVKSKYTDQQKYDLIDFLKNEL